MRGVLALADRPEWRWRLEVRVWRQMMRSRAARDEAEELLAGILGRGRGRDVWAKRARAAAYVVLPPRVAVLLKR